MSVAIRAGKAFVEILVDQAKFESGLVAARSNLKAFASFVEGAGQKLVFGGLLTGFTGGKALRTFVQFQDEMKKVQAVAEASDETLKKLWETGRRVGQDMGYRPFESAGAMVELAKAGFGVDEIEQATGAVLALSRATGEDLIRTTTNAAQTLRVFHLEASQMGEVADLMTVAANQSTASVEGLDEALKYAAPIAAQYGLTLKETLMAIAVMASAGVKGSMAGTSMRQMMLQLTDATKQADLLTKGVRVVDPYTNKMRSFLDVMVDIGEAMKNMSQSSRLTFAKELFDQRAVSGALNLITTDFGKLRDAMDNAADTSNRQARLMQDTLGGALRRLLSDVDNLSIGLGEGLLGSLLAVVAEIRSAVLWIDRFAEKHQKLTKYTVYLLASMLPLGAVMVAFAWILSTVGGALVVAGKAMMYFKAMCIALDPILAGQALRFATLIQLTTALKIGLLSLSRAMWGLVLSHPVIAGLAAIGAGIAAVAAYSAYASRNLYEFHDKMRKVREESARKQSEDRTRAGILSDFSKKGSLSPAEMATARRELKTLENRYGSFGVTIDGVAKKVIASADAFEQLFKKMDDVRVKVLNDDIKETMQNLGTVQDEIAAETKGWQLPSQKNEGLSILGSLVTFSSGKVPKELEGRLKELVDKRDKISAELQKLVAERDNIIKPPPSEKSPELEAARLTQDQLDWQDRVNKLRIRGIEDEHQKRLKDIELEYEIEARKIQDNSDLQGELQKDLLARVEEARTLAIRNMEAEYAKARKQEEIRARSEVQDVVLGMIENEHVRALALIESRYKREMELAGQMAGAERTIAEKRAGELRDAEVSAENERYRRSRRDIDRDRSWEIARLQAQTTIRDQKKLQKELLSIDEKRAIEEAKKNGDNIELIKKEFDLRRRLVDMKSSGPATLGAFNALVAPQAFGSQPVRLWERIAKASEETAKNTRKENNNKNQGIKVGP